MAIKDFLRLWKRGPDEWNLWRKENPNIIPDINQYDLSEISLSGYDLSRCNFQGARLRLASLTRANLHRANLSEANLSGASLMHADLTWADLRRAHMPNAFLNEADLSWADFSGAYLLAATFLNAKMGWTVFGANNLSTVIGLDTVHHDGPSTIGIDTVYLSQGNIPKNFLLRAGVRKEFIEPIQFLAGNPIKYYSCFISYATEDKKFVQRLYSDLINLGVQCWYSEESLKPGEEYPDKIREAIQNSDKVLVVLSKRSLNSEWVAKEVALAVKAEQDRKQEVIYPLKLDGAVTETELTWARSLWERKHFANFKNYFRGDIYRSSFKTLVSALEVPATSIRSKHQQK